MRTDTRGGVLMPILLVILMIGAPIANAGGVLVGTGEQAPAVQPTATSSSTSDQFFDVENVTVWDRSVLPLRANTSEAAVTLPNHQLKLRQNQTDREVNTTPVNRDTLAVYEPGNISIEFAAKDELTGVDTSQFSTETGEVIIGYLDENVTEDQIENSSFSRSDVPGSIEEFEEFLTAENRSRVNRNATFVEREITIGSDGGFTTYLNASNTTRYDPGTGHYSVIATNGSVFDVDADGNISRDGYEPGGAVIGIEGLSVQERTSDSQVIDPSTTVRPGDDVRFELNTSLGGSGIGHAVGLYHESEFINSKTRFNITEEIDRNLSTSDVIVEHELEEVNGVADFEEKVEFAGFTINDQQHRGTFLLPDVVSFAANETDVEEPNTSEIDVDRPASVEKRLDDVLDASATGEANLGRNGTLVVETYENFTADEYRFVHVASEEDTSQAFETSVGTVDLERNLTVNVVSGDGNAIDGATVDVGGRSADTNSVGNASFDLFDDTYTINVSASDFNDNGTTVTLGPENDTVEVVLQSSGGGGGGGIGGIGGSPSSGSDDDDDEGEETDDDIVVDAEPSEDGDENEQVVRSSDQVSAGTNFTARFQSTSEDESSGVRFRTINFTATSNVDVDITARRTGELPDEADEDVPTETGGLTYIDLDYNEEVSTAASNVWLTVEVNQEQLEQDGRDLEDVVLYRYDDDTGEWQELETKFRKETDTGATFRVRSPGLSVFTVTYQSSDISVTDASLGAEEIEIDESVDVTATLENAGEGEGEIELSLNVGDETVETKNVTVEGGSSTSTTFTYTPEESGEDEVTVNDVSAGTLTVTGGGGGGSDVLIWFIAILVLVVVIGGGYYYYTEMLEDEGGDGGDGGSGGFGAAGTGGGLAETEEPEETSATGDDFGVSEDTDEGDEDDGFGTTGEADEGDEDESDDTEGAGAGGEDDDTDTEATTATGMSAGDTAVGAADEAPSDARFELYEDKSGKYRWRLRHTNGNIVAGSGQGYASEAGINQAVKRMGEVAADADTQGYEPAGFEIYEHTDDQWYWRLRSKNGRVLAESYEGFSSRADARKAVDRVRTQASDEENFEGYTDDDKFQWRLTGADGGVLGESARGYSREDNAREAIGRVTAYAPEAETLDYDPAAYELSLDNEEQWRWRLRTMNGNIIADSSQGFSSKQQAQQGIRSVMNDAPEAEIGELNEDE